MHPKAIGSPIPVPCPAGLPLPARRKGARLQEGLRTRADAHLRRREPAGPGASQYAHQLEGRASGPARAQENHPQG